MKLTRADIARGVRASETLWMIAVVLLVPLGWLLPLLLALGRAIAARRVPAVALWRRPGR